MNTDFAVLHENMAEVNDDSRTLTLQQYEDSMVKISVAQ